MQFANASHTTIDTGTGKFVPVDPGNRDYAELVASGVAVRAYIAPAMTKADWLRRVDEDAERVRLKYITPGAGMAMTYQEKKDQSIAVLAMGEDAANALPNHGALEFPTISASVPIESPSLYQAAQLVMLNYERFAALSRVIELTRLNGKKSIRDASDAAQARAAYEAIAWTV